eukprot:2038290-Amphidinium_carterae.2
MSPSGALDLPVDWERLTRNPSPAVTLSTTERDASSVRTLGAWSGHVFSGCANSCAQYPLQGLLRRIQEVVRKP